MVKEWRSNIDTILERIDKRTRKNIRQGMVDEDIKEDNGEIRIVGKQEQE